MIAPKISNAKIPEELPLVVVGNCKIASFQVVEYEKVTLKSKKP